MAADDKPLDRTLRALADPTRRRIYGILARQPGLTTSQIVERIPSMTRWGVMKHLAQLREAQLLQTLAEGRRRRHYRETAPLESLRHWLGAVAE